METKTTYPRILPVGDAALTVEFGNSIHSDLNKKVYALEQVLKQRELPGLVEMVPTYRSLLIHFDPFINTFETMKPKIQEFLLNLQPVRLQQRKIIPIPTVYGGEFGPDLPFVAEHNHLTIKEVIQLHSSRDYPVYMMGFTAGFPYLGGMDPRIAAPRLEVPRKETPAGSVGIAGNQTGIYPITSPGGWRIIGRTNQKLFNPDEENPFLLSPGDIIRFVPIEVGA
ncbi:MAG: 5-oxoprolinase subunit PxpB [Anaerolineaceae bacterium]|nr:5-oxoprolinase subunit PxpB [Anaerolineaceae bacterium]